MNLTVDERQCIHCTGRARALRQVVAQLRDFGFVWNGDVQTAAARTLELADCGLEFLGRDLQQFVLDILVGLQRK